MTERERWIVYPLLFFALGAALRDKFTHEVRTDQLMAGKIACEELLILDSSKPSDEGQRRVVARLSSNAPQGRNASSDRYGELVLIGSRGEELCGVNNDQLVVSQIKCNQAFSQAFTVVDPQNIRQPLAVMQAVDIPRSDGKRSRVGSLFLTDEEGKAIFGLEKDKLVMRQVVCEGVSVTDPANPNRVLAGLGSLALKPQDSDAKPHRFGVLVLNNERFNRIVGIPLTANQHAADEHENQDQAELPPDAQDPTQPEDQPAQPAATTMDDPATAAGDQPGETSAAEPPVVSAPADEGADKPAPPASTRENSESVPSDDP